jgi:O-antigen/teichoic acid export membrane protein
MSKIRRLAGETVLYGLGSIVPRFINFFLVGIHTRVFHPEDYSVVTELLSYTAVINTLYLFGMETAYFRFSTKPGLDERHIFNITQTVVLAISGLGSLVLFLFAGDIAAGLEIAGHEQIIKWLAAVMFIDAAVAIPFAGLRLKKKALKFAIGKFINVFILVGLNVYFLMILYKPGEVGVEFVFLANLIANSFFLLFFFKTLLQWRPRFDRELTPVILQYSYPIMITGLAGMTSEMFSRLFLKSWLPENFYDGQTSAYALGVFGACYKLAVIMNLAITAFRYAAEPFFFTNAIEKNSPQLFARINHYFVIVCCFILLGVSINLDLLQYFFGRAEYAQGLYVVPILLLAYLFMGVYYNFSVWFKLTDRTYYGTIITIGGMIVTIVANYYLIPVAGYLGSSWAAVLCSVSMAAACFLLGKRFYPVPYSIARDLTYIIGTVGIVYLVNAIEVEGQLLASTFHAAVILLYGLGIFFLERKQFRQTLG